MLTFDLRLFSKIYCAHEICMRFLLASSSLILMRIDCVECRHRLHNIPWHLIKAPKLSLLISNSLGKKFVSINQFALSLFPNFQTLYISFKLNTLHDWIHTQTFAMEEEEPTRSSFLFFFQMLYRYCYCCCNTSQTCVIVYGPRIKAMRNKNTFAIFAKWYFCLHYASRTETMYVCGKTKISKVEAIWFRDDDSKEFRKSGNQCKNEKEEFKKKQITESYCIWFNQRN